jgi:hypothetical protein
MKALLKNSAISLCTTKIQNIISCLLCMLGPHQHG